MECKHTTSCEMFSKKNKLWNVSTKYNSTQLQLLAGKTWNFHLIHGTVLKGQKNTHSGKLKCLVSWNAWDECLVSNYHGKWYFYSIYNTTNWAQGYKIYIKKLEDNIQEHGERLKSNAGDKRGEAICTVKEFYLQKIQDWLTYKTGTSPAILPSLPGRFFLT